MPSTSAPKYGVHNSSAFLKLSGWIKLTQWRTTAQQSLHRYFSCSTTFFDQGSQTTASQIFVNLPVKNLDKSVEFFTRLGYQFNPQFTDKNATCMIVGENIFVMLLVESFFKTFTSKPICDATQSTEVLVCLSCESRAAVDDMVGKAVAAGGTTPKAPQDHGFMYQHGYQDLDGHLWELMYMDINAMPKA